MIYLEVLVYNVLSEHHWKQKRNSLTLLPVFIFLKTLYTLENYFVCLYIIIYFVFLYRLYFITSQWDTEAQVKYCGYNQKLMSELRFSLFASKAQTLCITSNCFFPPIKSQLKWKFFVFVFKWTSLSIILKNISWWTVMVCYVSP